MNWKKWGWMWLITILVGFYTTFVLQSLWNWFAVEALNAPPISYWIMFGLNMLVHLVIDKPSFEIDEKFKRVTIMLEACIPDAKMDEVKEALKEEDDIMPAKLGGLVVGQALGNTFALLLGFAVHIFLV